MRHVVFALLLAGFVVVAGWGQPFAQLQLLRPNTSVPPGVPANRGGNGVPPEIVEREVGVLFRHIVTVPNWSPESVPEGISPEIGRPYVAIFEKAK